MQEPLFKKSPQIDVIEVCFETFWRATVPASPTPPPPVHVHASLLTQYSGASYKYASQTNALSASMLPIGKTELSLFLEGYVYGYLATGKAAISVTSFLPQGSWGFADEFCITVITGQ